METETDDFLSHYGVKGMKWGVRRSQAQLDRAANRTTSRKQERRNASVAKQKAKSGEETSRQKNIRKAVKVATITGHVALIAGTAYAHHVVSKMPDVPVSTIRKPSPATQKSVLKVLNHPSLTQSNRSQTRKSSRPVDMSSWDDPNYVWKL